MKRNLLFLCTGNSSRSQMAEAYAKVYLGDRFNVYSAGVEKHGLNPYMLKVMEENGMGMSGHYSKHVSELDHVKFDVVVTVCGHANETCPTYLKKAKVIHKGFEDPAKATGSEEEVLNIFRKIRDEIKRFIKDELTNLI